jgi:prepilin-type N-terminal cleavage/methylation domain-containing protein
VLLAFGVFLKRRGTIRGFTLIELSIVLVVIGLIVGGVLVGQNLIQAAEVRAQITQIEKYNSAVNTFRSKFNSIPGDMTVAAAQQFGFIVGVSCTGTAGKRDGNGLIDGWMFPNYNLVQFGETALFWQDLSSAAAGNLIDGQFPNSGMTPVACAAMGQVFATQLNGYLPRGKIGYGTFVYVYENNGANWYGLSAISQWLDVNGTIDSATAGTIPVNEAYSIDKKIDDALPTSGNVQAVYIVNSGTLLTNAPNTITSGGDASSCYDTTTNTYSVTVNNGNGGNCALSFRFQ